MSEGDYQEIDKKDASNEFAVAFEHWQSSEPDWKKLYPKVFFNTYDLMDEMKDLDMFILMKAAERISKAENDKFKLLRRMANVSRF